jgi:hypothetical protein
VFVFHVLSDRVMAPPYSPPRHRPDHPRAKRMNAAAKPIDA